MSTFFSFTLGKLRFVESFRCVIFDFDDSGGWGGLAINEEEDDDDDEEEEEEEAESNLPLSRSRYLISALEPQREVKYSENS